MVQVDSWVELFEIHELPATIECENLLYIRQKTTNAVKHKEVDHLIHAVYSNSLEQHIIEVYMRNGRVRFIYPFYKIK
ncbi:hypothetical protein [Viridibacillus arvi]|uniref:hypothetical protein n=1 Tax=Viridibacillus arvi TaxID=263475 RepID=UPI0034CF9706